MPSTKGNRSAAAARWVSLDRASAMAHGVLRSIRRVAAGSIRRQTSRMCRARLFVAALVACAACGGNDVDRQDDCLPRRLRVHLYCGGSGPKLEFAEASVCAASCVTVGADCEIIDG